MGCNIKHDVTCTKLFKIKGLETKLIGFVKEYMHLFF